MCSDRASAQIRFATVPPCNQHCDEGVKSATARVRSPLAPGILSGSSYTRNLKIGTPVAAVPGAWDYRVSDGLVGPVSVYCDWVRWNV